MTAYSKQATRVAVVGCGAIAQSHLQYLLRAPGLDVVALVDSSIIVAKHLAEYHGGNIATFESATAMLEAMHPDVVHVLTPPRTHVPIATEALRAGAHVICEKPLSASSLEAAELVRHATEAGRIVIECQNYRFLEEMTWLRAVASTSSIGQVRAVDIDVRVPIASGGRFVDESVPHHTTHLAGGAVRDFLPHMVYLAEDLAPLLPVEVVGANWALRSGKTALGADSMTALLSGADFDIVLRFSALGNPPGFGVTVVGERGRAHADLFHRRRAFEARRVGGPLAAVVDRARGSWQALVDVGAEVRSKVVDSGQNGMGALLEAVYNSIRYDIAAPISTAQLIRTAQVTDDLVAGVAP